MESLTQQAIDIFKHAVAAVQPQQFMRICLEVTPPDVPVLVLGAGKASGAMALEAERLLGDRVVGGWVITNKVGDHSGTAGKHIDGAQLSREAASSIDHKDADQHIAGIAHQLKKIKFLPASHPVPDASSLTATETLLEAIASHPNAFILFLLSGGASSLMADVPPGSSLEEIQHIFDKLLKSGADIREMNTVRKHLSRVKGGQLAHIAYPSRICTIILSDVPGNDPAVIGSGPTVPDPTTLGEAWDILVKYKLDDENLRSKLTETPKPGDAAFAHSRYIVAASNYVALQAAQQKAELLGYHTRILTDTATGEAKDLGLSLAQQAIAYKGPYPACLLAGGETTVMVKGAGLGGRNQELALAAGIALKDAPHITLLSAGTDGIDGPTDAAGAFVNAQIMQQGPEALSHLENNDAYDFFEKTGSLLKTGHTHTNVMDLIVILITEPSK